MSDDELLFEASLLGIDVDPANWNRKTASRLVRIQRSVQARKERVIKKRVEIKHGAEKVERYLISVPNYLSDLWRKAVEDTELGEIELIPDTNGEASRFGITLPAPVLVANEFPDDSLKTQMIQNFHSTALNFQPGDEIPVRKYNEAQLDYFTESNMFANREVTDAESYNFKTVGLFLGSETDIHYECAPQQFHRFQPITDVNATYLALKKSEFEALDKKENAIRHYTGHVVDEDSTVVEIRLHRKMYRMRRYAVRSSIELRRLLVENQIPENRKMFQTVIQFFDNNGYEPVTTKTLEELVNRTQINFYLRQICDYHQGGKYDGKWSMKIRYYAVEPWSECTAI